MLCDYTNVWANILEIISDESMEKKKRFCLRYALQSALHVIWRERNKIKHEEKPMPVGAVMKMVEKGVRNKLSVMKSKGAKGWENGLQFWFSTRL